MSCSFISHMAIWNYDVRGPVAMLIELFILEVLIAKSFSRTGTEI